MSDEQLLRDAAFAAGLKIKAVYVDGDDNFQALIIGEKFTKQRIQWNPLKDDGDALRLAVKVQLFLDTGNFRTETLAGYQVCKKSGHCKDVREDHGTDPLAATRRAIVRAAAEIGRAMS